MEGAEKDTTNVAMLQPENADAVVCKTGCNQQENAQHDDANAGAAALRTDDAKPKRPRKLTAKALLDKIENLQTSRKSMFNKTGRLRAVIVELMMDRDCENEVKCTFDKYKSVCNEIQNTHDMLLELLPKEEAEKHVIWYKAKMLGVNDFVKQVNVWLTNTDADGENADNEETETQFVEADVRSNHSQSSIGSSASRKSSKSSSNRSSRSGRSSISTKRLQAEAERAALETRAAALKKKHDLEEQAAQLRRKQEQLELDTEIAASTAKLAVLMNEDGRSVVSNGKDSHVKLDVKPKEKHLLNPNAKQFYPVKTDANEQNESTANDNARATTSTNKDGYSTMTESNMKKMHTHQLNTKQDSKACVPVLQIQDGNLYTLLQKQNEITELLVQQQNLNSLPMREIPIFDGNPLSFQTFMKAFQHCVESKVNNAGDCLYYLHQYTRGQPQELVRSCQHMPPDRGYARAMELLNEHFGSELKISAAYMDKVLDWPTVRPEDVKGLQAYSLFLRECCTAMEDLEYLKELDMPANMKAVVQKLPYKLRERWRTKASDILECNNHRACFMDIVRFVEKQVRIVCDPIFGDLQDGNYAKQSKNVRSKSPQKTRNSFATNVITADHKSEIEEETTRPKFKSNCLYCSNDHKVEECPLLEKKTHRQKISFLMEKGVCFGCLCSGHISKHCERRMSCKKCGNKHPTVLHYDKGLQDTDMDTPQTTSADTLVTTCGHTGAGSSDGILSILPVQVKSAKGDTIISTYAFLDPGSTSTFCSESLMKRLKLTGTKANIHLRTMAPEQKVSTYVVRDLEIAGYSDGTFYSLPDVYTQKKMPVSTRNMMSQVELEKWAYLKHIRIPQFQAEVDLLIGTNSAKLMEPWEVINSVGEGPYAIKTLLGWVINGPLRGSSSEQNDCPVVNINRTAVDKLEELLINQYNHDFNECSSEQDMSLQEKKFMNIVTCSVKWQDGHYTMKLPFKTDMVSFPNNISVAQQRMCGLKRRFLKDRAFHDEYTEFMENVIKHGYAEKVPSDELNRSDGGVWYIPHHGVRHPQKKKLRVVFDCGAEFKGVSLNKQLLQGPHLTSSLLGVLTRFRQEPVAVMADIEAMYHQARVDEEHIDLLRFLWWPGGDTEQDVVEYRMKVHLFGATSSPSCACYALRKTAEDNSHDFASEVISTVCNNFYVDDLLKSLASESDTIVMVNKLVELCQRGGFTLSKWMSNSREVLCNISQEHRSKTVLELDLDRDKLPLERALGLFWCVETDVFSFKRAVKEQPHTRRGILSVVSSVYDPLGFLAPFTLKAKFLLRELCRMKYSWDDPVPRVLQLQWEQWLADLKRVTDFKVNRCFKPNDVRQTGKMQLHHFADASQDGYGTVSYLRQQRTDGVHVAFVLGKARVASLKQMTIPRMELTAAVLAVRVDKMLQNELQFELENSAFWTDSTSVLRYIRNEDKRFHVFVANRIAAIREASEVSQWRHVPTAQNPADDASRGLRMEQLLTQGRWLEGPQFLTKVESEWPLTNLDLNIVDDDLEVKKEVLVNSVSVTDQTPTCQLLLHFSDWMRLKIAVAWFMKFKKVLLKLRSFRKELMNKAPMNAETVDKEIKLWKATVRGEGLTVEDAREAETAIVRFIQQQTYQSEIAALSDGSGVKKESSVYKLDPILQDSLLRVGGRLRRAAMPETMKHPVILPKNHHASALILRDVHLQLGHAGRNHVLSTLRRKYWIINANAAVRKTISNCVTCRRQRGKLMEQKMADLPSERVTPDLPPFSNVGVDYFGPVDVKRGRSLVKRYGVLFTCMASRAVHLEVAYTLDTDSCINALRRFICRRGQVTHMRSDNGTNFTGAEKELKDAVAAFDNSKIQGSFLQQGIKWSFNPPAASHHGGVWERIIGMTRKILTSVLREQTLDDEGFHTVLCEVETILNDRPITKLSDDPCDLEALTPNHLLTMKGKPVLPAGLVDARDCYSKRRWKQAQYICDLFWKRWIREYLPLLQERHKWNKEKQNLFPGDIVLIADSLAPRSSWLLGRIEETFVDKKGLVRSARVKTKTSILVRPITKLCLLQAAQ